MRTTIQLPDETFRQLKTEAASSGMKLKDLVTEFVQKGLAGRATVTPVSRARSPLPVIRRSTGVTHPSMTNAEIEKLLTTEDCHAGS